MATSRLAIFTICSNNYIPMAKVLLQSARQHHPDAALYLCLADERINGAEFYPTNCAIVPAETLGIPDFRGFAFRYDIMEFNTALKPYMCRYLFAQGHQQVIYFDPDIEIFAPLDAVLEPLRNGALFVLTPHLTGPAEGDAFPDDIGIMMAGIYNLGFLGLSAGPELDRLLRWWARRVQFQCISAQSQGIFVDQKFVDLIPGFSDHVCVLRDSAYNVAYWNLAQRRLSHAEGRWLVDGEPLRFFHFSGIAPTNLTRLSKFTLAFRGAEIEPPLQALMLHYAQEVMANGYGTVPKGIYAYGRFASGVPIVDRVRKMFREQHLAWSHGDPFETYEEYLHLPIPGQWAGSSAYMITNLMEDLRCSDPWLRFSYDPTTPEGVKGYADWYVKNAGDLIGDWRLLQPVAERIGGCRSRGASRRAPPARSVGNAPDVTVIGYLRLALGVGEAGRQTLRALRHAGIDARGFPIELNSNSARVDDSLEPFFDDSAQGRYNIFNVNADQLPQVIAHLRGAFRPDAYRVIVPFWELERWPDAWLDAFELVDEVWAPTRFIQTSLVRALNKPILYMPLMLEFEPPTCPDPREFGLPQDKFLFFFAFDLFSFAARKNPMACVRAFKRAFPNDGSQVGLVLKTMNTQLANEEGQALLQVLREEPGITLIEGTFSRTQTLGLIASCDAVVSLHRSEGLGLLVAEAMVLGKPVIATDYSGTAELVSPSTGWPVDFDLIPVGPGEYPFHENQVWAEADEVHAAWNMRRVFEDRAEAARRASAARALISDTYGIEACSRRISSRLRQLDKY